MASVLYGRVPATETTGPPKSETVSDQPFAGKGCGFLGVSLVQASHWLLSLGSALSAASPTPDGEKMGNKDARNSCAGRCGSDTCSSQLTSVDVLWGGLRTHGKGGAAGQAPEPVHQAPSPLEAPAPWGRQSLPGGTCSERAALTSVSETIYPPLAWLFKKPAALRWFTPIQAPGGSLPPSGF